MNFIEEKFLRINERINSACNRSGRVPESVQLIVVTKNQPVEKILQVMEAGARRLGENYPEETDAKIKLLGAKFVPEWHMIGHIQSRKIQYLVQHFDFIHSIDRFEIASKISNAMVKANRTITCLLEVNISGEESKFGYDVSTPEQINQLSNEIEKMKALSNLNIAGLMTMPPMTQDIEKNRIIFQKCREILFSLQGKYLMNSLQFLSMGTSQDFEIAIEEGATHIRIGEAIIGNREWKR